VAITAYYRNNLNWVSKKWPYWTKIKTWL